MCRRRCVRLTCYARQSAWQALRDHCTLCEDGQRKDSSREERTCGRGCGLAQHINARVNEKHWNLGNAGKPALQVGTANLEWATLRVGLHSTPGAQRPGIPTATNPRHCALGQGSLAHGSSSLPFCNIPYPQKGPCNGRSVPCVARACHLANGRSRAQRSGGPQEFLPAAQCTHQIPQRSTDQLLRLPSVPSLLTPWPHGHVHSTLLTPPPAPSATHRRQYGQTCRTTNRIGWRIRRTP